jgi:predicted CopG family antitoxin
METTIKISKEVKEYLDKMKVFSRESYNDVIEVLIEDDLELNEKTKREIGERKKNAKFVSHEDVGKRLGL